MEKRLQGLMSANEPKNRMEWPMKLKKQGKKVVGTLYPGVPEELIHAAEMMPWRISGTWNDNIPLANSYMLAVSNGYILHVAETYLSGEIDFLDEIIVSGWDDDARSLYDIIAYEKRVPSQIIYMPHKNKRIHLDLWKRELNKMKTELEKISGIKITDAKLKESIKIFNETRSLLAKIYEFRKEENPPITGAEVLGISTAATVIPKEEYNKELTSIISFLKNRKISKNSGPRFFLSSSQMDDYRYVKLIEDAGAKVVMDDLDTGSTYFWGKVDISKDDPMTALAKYYLNQVSVPHLENWDEQVNQIIEWVKEFKVDAVLIMQLRSYFPPAFRLPYLKKRLKEAGIKEISFEREYQLADEGQLKTRVGAFIEMLRR